MWIDIIIILFLILLNGFFALSEIAIVSAKKSKLETERKAGKKGAVRALKLQSDLIISLVYSSRDHAHWYYQRGLRGASVRGLPGAVLRAV